MFNKNVICNLDLNDLVDKKLINNKKVKNTNYYYI